MVTRKELFKIVVPAYTKRLNDERKKKSFRRVRESEVFKVLKNNSKPNLEQRMKSLKRLGYIK